MGLKIGSFLGGLARTVSSVLPGPVGTLARGAVSIFTDSRPTPLVAGSVGVLQGSGSVTVQGPRAIGPSFSLGPGGASFQGPQFYGPSGQIMMGGGGGGVCMVKGYHENKTLVRAHVQAMNRGGNTPGMQRAVSQVVNQCVKNRSMNVLNGHAARRAVRRIKGAMKELHKIERMLPHRRSSRKASPFRRRK